MVRDANIVIGGSPSEGNVIEHAQNGTIVVDLDRSILEYSYNKVSVADWPFSGILMLQGVYLVPQSSRALIQKNTFTVSGNLEGGVTILDFGPSIGVGKSADFVISDNNIELSGSSAGPAYAGIETVFTVGAISLNNRIRGSGTLMGIAAEGDTQCMIKGNNVQNVTPDFVAIHLDPGTTNCTVVGGGSTDVYDEGNGNIMTGVNNMHGNAPGPAISQSMQRRRDWLKHLRLH